MSEVKEKPSFLEMSDEELMAYDPSALEELDQKDETDELDQEDPVENVEQDADEDEADQASDEEGDDETEQDADENSSDDEDQDDVSDADAPEQDSRDTEEAERKPADDKVEPEVEAVDYKAEYERLTAPFKANGREISVKNVDDAIALMQMGANYNKKMAALKPNLKLLKMLENNNLLTEEKISFLIDLEKKNPDAINKLMKDSGLDPMDLDTEKASAYRPKTYTVDDREIELDTVLDELQGSPAYNRTLDIVSNKWDGASKQTIAGSPQILKVLNEHVERGIYDLIIKEVESERVFGRLNGLSDIEAYRQVGDAIQARGGFDHLGTGRAPQGQQAPIAGKVVTPKPKHVDDERLKEKRRAASSTKPVAPKSTPKDFNPLALSDDEFSKIGIDKFL